MSIPITCPGCDAPFNVPDKLAGKTIRCTSCMSQMAVPKAGKPALEEIPEPLPIPLDDEDDAPRKFAAPRRPASGPAPSSRRQVRAVEEIDEDEDEDDDRPRKRKKAGKSNNVGMKVGIGIVGVLLVVGSGLGIYYATKGSKGGAASGGSGASAASWEEVPNPDALGFTARMPGTPTTDLPAGFRQGFAHRSGTSTDAAVRAYCYMKGDDEGYFAGYSSLPTTPAAAQVQPLLDQAIQGAKRGAPDAIDSHIEQDGYPGREVRFFPTSPNGKKEGFIVFRFVLAHDRLFTAFVGGKDFSSADDSRVKTFFNAYKITYMKGGSAKPAEAVAKVPKGNTPASVQPEVPESKADWHAIPNGESVGYTIQMPGPPTTDLPPGFREGFQSKAKGSDLPTAYCFTRGEAEMYFAGYNALPAAPDPSQVQALLTQVAAKLKSTGSKLGTKDTPITQDGYPGREVRISTGAGVTRRYALYRVILAQDRMFMVFATGDSFRNPSDPRFKTYFDSFKITYSPRGSKSTAGGATAPVPGPLNPQSSRDGNLKAGGWPSVPNPDGFTAEMPYKPEFYVDPEKNGRQFGEWAWIREDESYEIKYYQKSFSEKIANSSLADFVASRKKYPTGHLSLSAMKVTKETDIEINNSPGKELTYESANGGWIAVYRVVKLGDRTYEINVAVSGIAAKTPNLKRFLDSIKFTYDGTPMPGASVPSLPSPSNTAAAARPAPTTPAGGIVTQPPPMVRRTKSGRTIVVPGPRNMVPMPSPPDPLAVPDPQTPPPPAAAFGDLNVVAKIDPFWAVAFAPSKSEVFTVGLRPLGTGAAAKAAGMLRRYSYPDFKLKGSYQLPNLAAKAVYDDKAGILTVAGLGGATATQLIRANAAFERAYGDAVLQQFDLNPVFDGTVAERADLKPTALMASFGKPAALELSADGQALYCLAETLATGANGGYKARLLQIDPATRKIVKEMPLPEPTRDMTWSADGKSLYLTEWPVGPKNTPIPGKAVGLVVVDVEAWTKGPTLQLPGFTNDVTASPSGRLVAAVAGADRNRLYLLDSSGGAAEELKDANFLANNGYARFTPDGKRLVASSVGTQMGVDVYDVTVAASAAGYKRVASSLPSEAKPLAGYFRLSPDGQFALFNTGAILEMGK